MSVHAPLVPWPSAFGGPQSHRSTCEVTLCIPGYFAASTGHPISTAVPLLFFFGALVYTSNGHRLVLLLRSDGGLSQPPPVPSMQSRLNPTDQLCRSPPATYFHGPTRRMWSAINTSVLLEGVVVLGAPAAARLVFRAAEIAGQALIPSISSAGSPCPGKAAPASHANVAYQSAVAKIPS